MPTESTADSIRGVKEEGSAPVRLDDTPEKSTADSATRMKQDVSAHESRPEIANGNFLRLLDKSTRFWFEKRFQFDRWPCPTFRFVLTYR